MAEERVAVPASELARWAVVGVMILVGTALFFWAAPGSAPVAAPVVREAAR